MNKKVLQSIFDQGHSLTSRGQGRIFRVTAVWAGPSAPAREPWEYRVRLGNSCGRSLEQCHQSHYGRCPEHWTANGNGHSWHIRRATCRGENSKGQITVYDCRTRKTHCVRAPEIVCALSVHISIARCVSKLYQAEEEGAVCLQRRTNTSIWSIVAPPPG